LDKCLERKDRRMNLCKLRFPTTKQLYKLVIAACIIIAISVLLQNSEEMADNDAMNQLRAAAAENQQFNLQLNQLKLKHTDNWLKDIQHEVVEIPHPHENLHPDNLTLIDIHPFTMEINQDICNISNIALVTIIHTAVQNDDARRVIRDTWGNPTMPGVNTRLVFLTGRSEDPEEEAALKAEAHQFGDIVQGDFMDTYHNLSYKNIFGKLWVSEFCEQAEFVVKTDDDMFIDLYATYNVTRQYLKHPKYLQDEFILCPKWYGMTVLREGKWAASYEDISKEEGDKGYPTYCTGWIYIVNPGTAGRISEVAQTTKFFWIDDAWVTGYLPKALGIEHIDLIEFFVMELERIILSKSVQNPEIYHRDYLAAPNARNFEISYALHKYAEWCYRHNCYNNMYRSKDNISDTDQIADLLLDKYKLEFKSES